MSEASRRSSSSQGSQLAGGGEEGVTSPGRRAVLENLTTFQAANINKIYNSWGMGHDTLATGLIFFLENILQYISYLFMLLFFCF